MLSSDAPVPAATAARAILGGLVRHAITMIGTSLVARGYADQDAVSAVEPAVVDYLVGALIVAGSLGWSSARASLSHSRWAAAWAALNGPAAVAPAADDPLRPAPPTTGA